MKRAYTPSGSVEERRDVNEERGVSFQGSLKRDGIRHDRRTIIKRRKRRCGKVSEQQERCEKGFNPRTLEEHSILGKMKTETVKRDRVFTCYEIQSFIRWPRSS